MKHQRREWSWQITPISLVHDRTSILGCLQWLVFMQIVPSSTSTTIFSAASDTEMSTPALVSPALMMHDLRDQFITSTRMDARASSCSTTNDGFLIHIIQPQHQKARTSEARNGLSENVAVHRYYAHNGDQVTAMTETSRARSRCCQANCLPQ
jgi:hypothetical protein